MNLFAGMDISDITRRTEASSNLFNGLLQAWGMGQRQANWKAANTLPPARTDAPSPSAPVASPNITTGPDIQIGQNKPWMPTATQLAAAPYTNGVSTVAPPIQDAPAHGFREPANWDGTPKTSWWQEPDRKSFMAKDSAQLGTYLFEAQQLPPDEALNRVARIRSENSDWLVSGPIREMFDGTEQNIARAQSYLHQKKMEQVAQQGREIQLGAATGIAKQYSEHMSGINKVLGNANPAERAVIAQIQSKETIKGVGGLPVLDPEAVSMLGEITTAQNARLASESNARNIKLAQETPPELRVSVTTDPATGQPRVSTGRPAPSVAAKTVELSQGVKDQRARLAAKIRLGESELGQLNRSMVDAKPANKAILQKDADALQTRIDALSKEWSMLGTNVVVGSTAAGAPAPSSVNPNDPLGILK